MAQPPGKNKILLPANARTTPPSADTSTGAAASSNSDARPFKFRVRTLRACHGCRVRKIKCTGEQPRCASCAAHERECRYEEVLSRQGIIEVDKLMGELNRAEDNVMRLLQALQGRDRRAFISALEEMYRGCKNRVSLLTDNGTFRRHSTYGAKDNYPSFIEAAGLEWLGYPDPPEAPTHPHGSSENGAQAPHWNSDPGPAPLGRTDTADTPSTAQSVRSHSTSSQASSNLSTASTQLTQPEPIFDLQCFGPTASRPSNEHGQESTIVCLPAKKVPSMRDPAFDALRNEPCRSCGKLSSKRDASGMAKPCSCQASSPSSYGSVPDVLVSNIDPALTTASIPVSDDIQLQDGRIPPEDPLSATYAAASFHPSPMSISPTDTRFPSQVLEANNGGSISPSSSALDGSSTLHMNDLRRLGMSLCVAQPLNSLSTEPLSRVYTDFCRQQRQCLAALPPRERPSGGKSHLDAGPLIDARLYATASPLERWAVDVLNVFANQFKWPAILAYKWLMTQLMQWQISPKAADYDSMPAWLRPTHLQLAVPHPAWIDYLPWPAVRDTLIVRPELVARSDDFIIPFAGALSVSWPAAAGTSGKAGGAILNEDDRRTISPAFERHIRVLDHWTVDEGLLTLFPELRGVL